MYFINSIQTDLEKEYDNVLFGTALAHHKDTYIFIGKIHLLSSHFL